MIIIPKWGTWGEINVIMALLQSSDLLNKHTHQVNTNMSQILKIGLQLSDY